MFTNDVRAGGGAAGHALGGLDHGHTRIQIGVDVPPSLEGLERCAARVEQALRHARVERHVTGERILAAPWRATSFGVRARLVARVGLAPAGVTTADTRLAARGAVDRSSTFGAGSRARGGADGLFFPARPQGDDAKKARKETTIVKHA